MLLSRKQQDNYAVLMGTLARMNQKYCRYISPILRFYAEQFAKSIDHSEEKCDLCYLYTAQFSNHILKEQREFEKITLFDDPNKEFDPFVFIARKFERNLPYLSPSAEMDGITYPSVENLYSLENIALKPHSLDKKYTLECVYDFQVTEEKYATVHSVKNTNEAEHELTIQCIDHTPIKASRFISDSVIEW